MHDLATLIYALVGASILSAQMMLLPAKRPQPELLWNSGTLAVLNESGTKLLVSNPQDGLYHTIEPPLGCLGMTAWMGKVTSVRLVGEAFYYSERLAPGKWNDYPIVNEPKESGLPFRLYESEHPDLFFGINVDLGFVKDRVGSCCAWFRKRDNGHLEIDGLITLEWDTKPIFNALNNNEGFVTAAPTKELTGLAPFLDHPIRVPGAFIVVSWRAGILWVIEDGKISASRVVDLIGIEKGLVRGDQVFPVVILGIQPMKDGKILIAHRDPRAIHALAAPKQNRAKEALDPSPAPPLLPEFPAILWKIWDPLKSEPPSEAPSEFIGRAPMSLPAEVAQWTFRFGFDLQGKLVFPWRSPSVAENQPDSAPPEKPVNQVEPPPEKSGHKQPTSNKN